MADTSNSLSWPILGAQIMSTVLTAGGQLQRGNVAAQIGQRTQAADQFQATQLRSNAGQQIAAGQIGAENQDLSTSYLVSKALARAAASGGGASDPTVINNIARISGEGKYRADVSRYEGDSAARSMNLQADALDWQGQNAVTEGEYAKKASRTSAFATVLSGAARTMAGKYWLDN